MTTTTKAETLTIADERETILPALKEATGRSRLFVGNVPETDEGARRDAQNLADRTPWEFVGKLLRRPLLHGEQLLVEHDAAIKGGERFYAKCEAASKPPRQPSPASLTALKEYEDRRAEAAAARETMASLTVALEDARLVRGLLGTTLARVAHASLWVTRGQAVRDAGHTVGDLARRFTEKRNTIMAADAEHEAVASRICGRVGRDLAIAPLMWAEPVPLPVPTFGEQKT